MLIRPTNKLQFSIGYFYPCGIVIEISDLKAGDPLKFTITFCHSAGEQRQKLEYDF